MSPKTECLKLLDQELISYHYSSCCSCCCDRIKLDGTKFSRKVFQI